MNIMDIWRLWDNHQWEHHQTQSVILVVHLVVHTQFMGMQLFQQMVDHIGVFRGMLMGY